VLYLGPFARASLARVGSVAPTCDNWAHQSGYSGCGTGATCSTRYFCTMPEPGETEAPGYRSAREEARFDGTVPFVTNDSFGTGGPCDIGIFSYPRHNESGCKCWVYRFEYTCACTAGFVYGAPTTNEAATCTEKTCADIDGSGSAASCGTGASCSDGGSGDGYTCTCNAEFYGATTTNEAATCTEKTCADIDGSGSAASCGTGASCSDGGSGDGYTCTCNEAREWWDGSACTPIPCDGEAFAGDAGACECAAGFSGAVSYEGGAPTGCVAVPKTVVSDGSSDSSKDEGKYIVLFVGVFFVLAGLVGGGLYAAGVIGSASAGANASALPTKAPKDVQMTNNATV